MKRSGCLIDGDPALSNATKIALFFIIALLNGFFVMAEYSLVRVRKSRLEELIQQGNGRARLVLKMALALDTYLSAAQMGITVASLALGWLGGPFLVELLRHGLGWGQMDPWSTHLLAVVLAFLILVFVHVVFGELVPRTIALGKIEQVALAVSWPLYIFYIFTYPLVVFYNRISRAVLQLMGINPVPDEDITHSEDELRMIVSASERGGVLDHMESRLIDNVFDFADRVAREVMVPRQDMVCLFTDDSLAENMKMIKETGHTRYPLCIEDRDHVVGMLHIRDLMNMQDKAENFDLRQIMREIVVVPEGMSIAKVLQTMQKRHIQMAVVADEYGGTAGLVTMEDLLEEIVGDIQDEHDTDGLEIERMPDGSYEFDGLVILDDVAEILNIEFDEPEEDTIGGFVFGLLGRQPAVGDKVIAEGYQFEVLSSTGFRVVRVRVTPLGSVSESAEKHDE
ncbi:MAG: hemolysin family protein [Acidaminococcaceae bacterium]